MGELRLHEHILMAFETVSIIVTGHAWLESLPRLLSIVRLLT